MFSASWWRSTERTSIRSRSGAANTSSRTRTPRHRPSGPPSATIGATTDASTTSTLGFECSDGISGADATLATTLDRVEGLIERGGGRDQHELLREELLEGFSCALCATRQLCMDVIGNIAHLHVRHACLIHAISRSCAIPTARSRSALHRADALGSFARHLLRRDFLTLSQPPAHT